MLVESVVLRENQELCSMRILLSATILACLLTALSGCAAPKQARFTLNDCGETIPFDPMAAEWRFEPEPHSGRPLG